MHTAFPAANIYLGFYVCSQQDKQQQAGKAVDVSISPDVVATLAQAESERASASGSNPETDQALKQQIVSAFAGRLAVEESLLMLAEFLVAGRNKRLSQ